jgi:Ca2+-binding EF-hand superfamily protein
MKTVLVVMCALATGVAAAGEGGHEHGKWDAGDELRMMDANQDGRISAEEHAAGAKKMFGKMDANADGNVTAAEMDAGQKAIKGERHGEHQDAHAMSSADKIRVVDASGDGILSAQEHAAGAREMFQKMDTDRDGALTDAELRAGHERMMKK